MKSVFKEKSINLRKEGYSVKEISHLLSVARGSVSTWVRDVVLTPEQKLHLKQKCHFPDVVEKRRLSRISNEKKKKDTLIMEASQTIEKIDKVSLKWIGLGLYWGEGAKTMQGMARISNSDPSIIMMSVRFLREVCDVNNTQLRGHIHIHSPEAVEEAENYWSKVIGIPRSQFYKTYVIKSTGSKNIRKTLPYGTVDVGVCDTKLLLKILGWIEGIKNQTLI